MTGLIGKLVPPPASLLLPAAPYAAIAALALLCWHFDARAAANADAVKTQAAQFKEAQASAAIAWNKKFADEKAADAKLAQENERAHTNDLADARAAADRFIASHLASGGGVQPQAPAGGAGSAPARAADHGPGVPAPVPAGSVLVSADDVQRCTGAVTYALGAHDFIIERAAQK